MNEYKKRVPRDFFCTHFCTHSILPNAVAQYFQRLQPPQKTGSSPVPSANRKRSLYGSFFYWRNVLILIEPAERREEVPCPHFSISGITFSSTKSTLSNILGLNVPVTPTVIFFSLFTYIRFPPSPIAANTGFFISGVYQRYP